MNGRKVVFLCLLLLLLSAVAHAKIVFGSARNGVMGIYVMDDDGSNQTLIRRGPFPNCWSPDGKQILYSSFGLSLMNADGTNARKLIGDDPGGSVGTGSFSPDSKSIVFKRSFRKTAS